MEPSAPDQTEPTQESGQTKFDDRFRKVSPEWQKIGDDFTKMVRERTFGDFIGSTDDSTVFRAYHGTTRDKLPLIFKDGGMKAFFEKEGKDPGIYITLTPTNALWHAIENGPHDTLRKAGAVEEKHDPRNATLLMVEVPKDWLRNQPEATQVRKSKIPEWIRQQKGWSENYTNIDIYTEYIKEALERIENGQEEGSFGKAFPVSFLPKEFIFVIDQDGTKRPLDEQTQNPS